MPDESSSTRRSSVLAIIVSYKTAALVEKSLAALAAERRHAAAQGVDVRALVVDNASGDADPIRRAIAERNWSEWAEVVVSEHNGGFAYGNNIGFRRAFGSGHAPHYFYLLNPDTEVREGAIGALARFLDRRPRAGMAGSSLENADGSLWPYAFRFPTLWSEVASGASIGLLLRLLDDRVVLRKMGDTPEAVDWFPGASMMIRREVLEDLGGMDEGYFLYYEETDFFLKAKAAGWSAWYVPESRVMHVSGASTGVTGAAAMSRRLPSYWFESRRRYFAKNHGLGYAVATDVAAAMANLVGSTKRALLRRRHENVPYFVRDLLRHSAIRPLNRSFSPPLEFKPARRT